MRICSENVAQVCSLMSCGGLLVYLCDSYAGLISEFFVFFLNYNSNGFIFYFYFFFRVKARLYGFLHLDETYPAYQPVHFTTFHLRDSMWLSPLHRLAMARFLASIILHKQWRQQWFTHFFSNLSPWLELLIWLDLVAMFISSLNKHRSIGQVTTTETWADLFFLFFYKHKKTRNSSPILGFYGEILRVWMEGGGTHPEDTMLTGF